MIPAGQHRGCRSPLHQEPPWPHHLQSHHRYNFDPVMRSRLDWWH
ncbi:hypothetical protein Hanom_Chr09g00777531 [Helianthus anomalus]